MNTILYIHSVPITSEKANLVQVRSMCYAFHNLGFNTFLSLPEEISNNAKELAKDEPYNLHFRKSISSNKRLNKYFNFRSIRNAISIINPDLCYLRSPLVLKQTLSSKKPIIIELHNNTLHERYKFLDNYWRKLLIKSVQSGQVIKVVCISHALSEYWANNGIDNTKIVTAHDGINHYQFENQSTQSEARLKLGLPADSKIVTYAGRLYANRKIDHIISLATHFPKIFFMIIGGPEDQRRFFQDMAQKQAATNILFTGHLPQNQVKDYLYASDVLLALWSSEVPTINYCSPLKLFEYMGAGRIILAHGFPTIMEVLQHKVNAIIVKPDSLEDLIAKTRYALELTYPSKIADQARTDVLQHYTWEKRATTILSWTNL